MKTDNSRIAAALLSILFLFATALNAVSAAPVLFSIGGKLEASNWHGSNTDSGGRDFETESGQAGFNASLQKGRFYAGLNIKGGEFEFTDGAPNQVTNETTANSNEETIKRGEFDLMAGYYFWKKYSLFIDFKSVTNEYQDSDYTLVSKGLGIGVSGYQPLSAKWIIFGSIGAVKLDLTVDGKDVGDGTGDALEIGFMYRINERTSLTMSARNQKQAYKFNNGEKQTHEISAPMVFGINHRFGGR